MATSSFFRTNSRWLRSFGLALGAASCVATLTVSGTVSSDVRLTANALIMTGTFTSTPTPEWMAAISQDYINPTVGALAPVTTIPVTTPETLPLNLSVAAGLADLEAAMAAQQLAQPGQPYVIQGISQSAVISILEKQKLAALKAAGQPIPDVEFVVIGSGNRPNGGLFSRYSAFYIPLLGIDFNGPAPTNSGITTVDISRQYDFFADWPTYPLNVLADLNILMGLTYVHSTYDNGQTPITGPYTDHYVEGSTEIVKQQDGDTTYYFIPTTELPLFGPLRAAGVPEGVIDIVEPLARVLVEAGYDRSIPFGQYTPAQLIPTIDPVTLTLQIAGATADGANNALKLFGSQLPGYSALKNVITKAEAGWAPIGKAYSYVISSINQGFNPIVTIDQLERPFGLATEKVLNALGIGNTLPPSAQSKTPSAGATVARAAASETTVATAPPSKPSAALRPAGARKPSSSSTSTGTDSKSSAASGRDQGRPHSSTGHSRRDRGAA